MSGIQPLFFSRGGNRLVMVLESMKFFARGDGFAPEISSLIKEAQDIAKEIDAATEAFKHQLATADERSSALNKLNMAVDRIRPIIDNICQVAESHSKTSKNEMLLNDITGRVKTEMHSIYIERDKLSKKAPKEDGPTPTPGIRPLGFGN